MENEKQEIEIKNFIIGKELVTELLDYLIEQKYKEVAPFVKALISLRPCAIKEDSEKEK